MSKDIILGESPRDWSRGLDLLADPVTAPAPASHSLAAEALRQAMDFNASVKIRPAGHGATATKVWKWG
jgi:hypothetical protein